MNFLLLICSLVMAGLVVSTLGAFAVLFMAAINESEDNATEVPPPMHPMPLRFANSTAFENTTIFESIDTLYNTTEDEGAKPPILRWKLPNSGQEGPQELNDDNVQFKEPSLDWKDSKGKSLKFKYFSKWKDAQRKFLLRNDSTA